MDIKEARKLVWDYEKIPNPNETDDFLYTEAMEYLIEEKRNPEDMLRLGGWYYEKKIFGPALRWYETAADLGSISACEGLGYIWYYGRTGKKDYERPSNTIPRPRKRASSKPRSRSRICTRTATTSRRITTSTASWSRSSIRR